VDCEGSGACGGWWPLLGGVLGGHLEILRFMTWRAFSSAAAEIWQGRVRALTRKALERLGKDADIACPVRAHAVSQESSFSYWTESNR